jgi:hypothetical protein
MSSKGYPTLRFAVIRDWIQRLVVPFLVVSLCALAARKYGGMALILVAGFVSAVIGLPIALYKGILVPLLRGVQCPTCREWGLVRAACISFGYRFYRCEYCGQRCKRLDYDSPWVDSSGKDDDDMYKPIPLFGPIRKLEATRCALLALATLAALFVFPLLGFQIGGERGSYVGSVIGVSIFLACQRDEKKAMRVAPVLWDRELDHGLPLAEPDGSGRMVPR